MPDAPTTTSGPATLIPFGLGSTHPIRWGPVLRTLRDQGLGIGAVLGQLRSTPCFECHLTTFHTCAPRLEALPALQLPGIVPFDVARLADDTSATDLVAAGRVTKPLVRTRTGFETLSWDDALAVAAPTADARWYPATRGVSDETLLEIHRIAALRGDPVHLGVPHSSRAAVGWNTATTEDLIESERILLWGTSLHTTSPDLLRVLAAAKDRGARVIWFSETYDAAMAAHRFPNTLRSALFGSNALDAWYPVSDLGSLACALRDDSIPARESGLGGSHLAQLRAELASATRVVSIWDELDAVDPVLALHAHHAWEGVGSGFLPIPAGPSVPGAEAIGISPRPAEPSDWSCAIGPVGAGEARVKVFLDTHLRPAMLEPAETTVVLPIQPLEAQRGGAWLTTANGRVLSSPGLDLPSGRARPAWCVPGQLAAAADPAHAGEIPASIEAIRDRLRALPTHAHTHHLEPGGWARIPRR